MAARRKAFWRGRRRRVLLESIWLITSLATAAVAAYIVADHFPHPADMMPVASFTSTVSKCSSASRTCVIDGDTIRIGGETIRMMDIDAPETRNAKCPAELERGTLATRRLIEILNAGQVSVAKRGSRDIDRYGRSLRIVMVDGRSAGDILVSEGLARTWSGKRRPWC